jgi:hypothetical protein
MKLPKTLKIKRLAMVPELLGSKIRMKVSGEVFTICAINNASVLLVDSDRTLKFVGMRRLVGAEVLPEDCHCSVSKIFRTREIEPGLPRREYMRRAVLDWDIAHQRFSVKTTFQRKIKRREDKIILQRILEIT